MKSRKALSLLLILALALSLLAVPALGAEAESGEALTRGEFILALFRLCGDETTEPAQTAFTDVPAEGELARAVRWALDAGVVNGYGGGLFGPGDPVTREQAAVMLYRRAQALGQGFTGLWMFPLEQPDAADISPWADEAVRWAVMKGLLIAADRGLEPKAAVTRDQLEPLLRDWLAAVGGTEEDGQNPVMNFVGAYQCGRAHALVECDGADGARITIEWGSSAWELTRWVITGPLDPEALTLDYTGCVMTVLTWNDEGELADETVVYEDGTGRVTFGGDGSFTWREDRSEREPLRFTLPVPTAVAGVRREEEFGGAYILLTIDEFNELGFAYGDSVRIEFSNGCVMEDLPYYNGYYTLTGEPLLVAYPGYPYIKAAINNGGDLFVIAGLTEEDTALITLLERGKYAAIQDARDIHYTDDRADYESDEVFANFRSVRAGDIREGILLRSASPCDNQHNRAPYADALMGEAGAAFILNLSDNEQKIGKYLAAVDFASPHFLALYESGRVEPIALNMNYGSAEFKAKLAAGLVRMAAAEGPYLVHCTEGKDRTGFVCMLLEALCGADYEEIADDYMITYRNYYGITREAERERYDVIVANVLDPMIRSLSGEPEADVRTMDLAAAAEQYLSEGGMNPEEIALLRERLTGG